MRRRNTAIFVLATALTLFATLNTVVTTANAAVDDVLFGAASSQDSIDFSTITSSNFADYFTYNGASTSSLTIGGNVEAQIGAIWTGGATGEWREIKIIVDSNGDDVFTPFDWSDPVHPWNPPTGVIDGQTWTYTYPSGYPDTNLANTTITMTWNATSWMVEGFPWDTWQQWWYEENFGADKTDNWWMESGQIMNVWWSGRDQNWNMLPNGDYKVKVHVDENGDTDFASDEANKTMIITIETAYISGRVVDSGGNGINRASVEAGSYLAWGETLTDSDGYFTVSGLQAGAGYHLRVQADGKVTHESETDIQIPTGEVSASAGTITLSDAVTITGTIKLDRDADGLTDEAEDQFVAFTNQWGWEQTNMWVWINANNTQGPGWGNTDVQFEVGDASIAFTINIPPPSADTTYHLNVNSEGYVATIGGEPISSATVNVTSSGGTAGTIVLTKASRLFGTVRLPAAISTWNNIDVQAISNADDDERYWGWGNIDPYSNGGSTDTGSFQIDGIPAGTYRLEVRVMGYQTHTSTDVAVVQGTDKDMGELTILEGSKITGTLTIQGDTTNLQRWEGDSESPMYIWIDAWSYTGGWSGTNVQVDRGVDQAVSYSLGGLSDATYEVNCWLGEGYDLVDASGNSPIFVAVSGTASANLILKPHEGVVQGTISGSGVTIDLNDVVVEVKRPWDWLPPKIATVANGKINSTTGAYSVSGLGTGDYVVKVGAYQGFIGYDGNPDVLANYNGEGFLVPDASIGVVIQRTFVQNDEDNPTTLNISLSQGYSISGTVALATGTNAPWHDFGDGVYDSGTESFGDPNGRKDTNINPMLSEAINYDADINGQPVMAMPMEMMFMGGEDPRMGMISCVSDVCTYSIDGLAPGVYMLMPPFSSDRISAFETDDSSGSYSYDSGQETHHWTATPITVVITDEDVTGKDFTLGNGYTVTGQLTLPEAQTVTEDWEAWQWVGQLELETAQNQYMGHSKSLMKQDFNQGSRYSFTFNHVANGDYLVRFWTDRYVPSGAKFTVNSANTSVNLTVEEGANLVGKIVDAETGEAVTSADGIQVRCEAIPYVEGSWRETQDDSWSLSYIEDGEDLQNSGSTEEGSRENNTPGKFHLTALPTGHKYVIVVEASHGKKTNGAKNYVGRVIAGIEIPEGASGDINVGTIKLTEGTTIQGRITDSNGNGIPGIDVIAIPSNTHDGTAEAEGVSDTQGYYTVYGISPNVEYYDLIAAERPSAFDDWGKQVQWGEKRKYNVAPETTNANFTLYATTASLSGTITIPSGAEFMMPFRDEMDFPATMILLQRNGVIYKDVMDGIEVMSAPAPSGSLTTTYTIDNLVPGTFKAIFMNYGLPTKITENVVVAEGGNTLDVTWDTVGHTRSGALAMPTGGYPTSADITGVLCMDTSDQSLIFGNLTEDADETFTAYEVPGLASGHEYQLVFFLESGMEGPPDIFTVGAPFTMADTDVTGQTATITRNSVPVLMVQAIKDTTDTSGNTFKIGIFSTGYLNDDSIEVVDTEPTTSSTAGEIHLTIGDGTISDVVLSGDKRNITATYLKESTDTDITMTLAVHYGDDDTTLLETLSFNVNTLAKNEDSVSIYIPGQVKLGNGDASQIYVPAGSLTTTDKGKAIVTIEKTDEEPGSLVGQPSNVIGSRGIFSRTATRALPADATAAGDQYDFSVSAANEGATASVQGYITIQIQYDPSLTAEEVQYLQIIHYVNGEWVVETRNRTVDTENHTISVDVDSLSPFMPAVVRSSDDDGGGDDDGGDDDDGGSSGGGGGGGCFIATTASAQPSAATMNFYLLVLLAGAALGQRCVRKVVRARVRVK